MNSDDDDVLDGRTYTFYWRGGEVEALLTALDLMGQQEANEATKAADAVIELVPLNDEELTQAQAEGRIGAIGE